MLQQVVLFGQGQGLESEASHSLGLIFYDIPCGILHKPYRTATNVWEKTLCVHAHAGHHDGRCSCMLARKHTRSIHTTTTAPSCCQPFDPCQKAADNRMSCPQQTSCMHAGVAASMLTPQTIDLHVAQKVRCCHPCCSHACRNVLGILKSAAILVWLTPQAVLGTGGHVIFPTCVAAKALVRFQGLLSSLVCTSSPDSQASMPANVHAGLVCLGAVQQPCMLLGAAVHPPMSCDASLAGYPSGPF